MMMNFVPSSYNSGNGNTSSNNGSYTMLQQPPAHTQLPQAQPTQIVQQHVVPRANSPMSSSHSSSTTNSASTFPVKLYTMLTDSERLRFDDTVCWMGNQAFKVIDPHRFSIEIMPQYFNQTKYKSFQRQLNIYNFQKVHYGPLKGCYTHKFLVKGHPELCEHIKRESSSVASAVSAAATTPLPLPHKRTISMDGLPSNTNTDPMPLMAWDISTEGAFGDMSSSGNNTVTSEEDIFASTVDEIAAFATSNMASFDNQDDLPAFDPTHLPFNPQATSASRPNTTGGLNRGTSVSTNAVLDNDDIAFFKNLFQPGSYKQEKAMLDTFVVDQHQQRNAVPQQQQQQAAPVAPAPVPVTNYASPVVCQQQPMADMTTAPFLTATAVSEYNFPRKLYRLLEDCDSNPEYHSICSWLPDGKQFKIHNKKRFVDVILPNYFDQTQYASFRRQLNMYSFVRQSMSTYANPYFVRGHRELLDHVVRKNGNGNKKD